MGSREGRPSRRCDKGVDWQGEFSWFSHIILRKRCYIVQVPIMLRSTFCILRGLQDQDLYDLNECPYDSGGYFIINGSEKVLIAQERMATNHVYVFAKAQPSPINFLAEIRSAVEKGGKTISQFQVKMFHRNQERSVSTFLLKTMHPAEDIL